MSERERKAWLRQLHIFDDQAKRERGPQGRVGNDAFRVINALFFLQHRDGTLCPSKAAIAAQAKLSIRTAHDVLTHLRDLGVIGWQRRCKPGIAFPWVQDTSAYYLKPPSEWRGYKPDTSTAPPPFPEAWGACPALPAPIDLWAEARKQGAGVEAQIKALQIDPSDRLAVALGGLRSAMVAPPRDGKPRRDTNPLFIPKRGEPEP